MPSPDDELPVLPDSLRKAIAAAQRELGAVREQSGTAPGQPGAGQAPPVQREAPAPPPRLDDRTLLEVEAVRPGYPIVHDFLPDLEGFYEDWLGRELPS